ncbi:MAG: sigma-70 family RNA polymerase sigma factor [Chitinophagaceae bacterium]|nr:sigma-70 family RNA polymerase sigma factor [Chitinophagaceae bacterium]
MKSKWEVNALLASIAGGDEKAFTRIVDLYWNKVYSHALAYVRSSQRAQEITQDIFLHVWVKRNKLNSIINFDSYLFILGRNRIISAMRKKLEEPSCEIPLNVVGEILPPDLQFQTKETWEFLLKGIEELPPVRKIVFKMSRLDGWNNEKIGSELNISNNTVKDHITLAIKQLRQYVRTHPEHFAVLLCLCVLFPAE